MSAARDVIARALVEVRDGFIAEHGLAALTISLGNFAYADGVLAALSTAGYRIVGPGEVDRETLEKAAEVADEAKQMRERLYAETPAGINAHKAVQAEEIAAAIRALGGKDA